MDRKLANAYAMSSCADAKAALEKLHRELLALNPSATRSLEEGIEETLTVLRLGLDVLLTLYAGEGAPDSSRPSRCRNSVTAC